MFLKFTFKLKEKYMIAPFLQLQATSVLLGGKKNTYTWPCQPASSCYFTFLEMATTTKL